MSIPYDMLQRCTDVMVEYLKACGLPAPRAHIEPAMEAALTAAIEELRKVEQGE